MKNYTVFTSGNYVRYQTTFGLAVEFNGISTINIYMPPQYRGKVMGICGNFDRNYVNDMVYVNGINYYGRAEEFGSLWEYPEISAGNGTSRSVPWLMKFFCC